jgi:hypothetical protein
MVNLVFLFFCFLFFLVLDFTRLLFLTGPNFPAGPAASLCVARSLAHLLCCCFVGYKKTPRSFLSVGLSVRPFFRPSIRRGLLLLVGLFCCEFVYFGLSFFVLLLFSLHLCLQTSSRLLLLTRNTQLHREETQRERMKKERELGKEAAVKCTDRHRRRRRRLDIVFED